MSWKESFKDWIESTDSCRQQAKREAAEREKAAKRLKSQVRPLVKDACLQLARETKGKLVTDYDIDMSYPRNVRGQSRAPGNDDFFAILWGGKREFSDCIACMAVRCYYAAHTINIEDRYSIPMDDLTKKEFRAILEEVTWRMFEGKVNKF